MAEGAATTSPVDQLYDVTGTGKKVDRNYMRDLYDNWSANYDKEITEMGYEGLVAVRDKVSELCPNRGSSILEVAAGTGMVGEALKVMGFTDLTGTDISQKSLDISAKKGCYKEVLYAECGEGKMPFDDNSFDALLAIFCLGHGHIEPVALRDWFRIVKPGGLIIATVRHYYIDDEDSPCTDYGVRFFAEVNDAIIAGKIREESRGTIPNFWQGTSSYIFVFKVLE